MGQVDWDAEYWTEEVEGEWYVTVPLILWDELNAKLEQYEQERS